MSFPAFSDFASALDDKSYQRVADDWLIAIGDVVGSTTAIAAGRYKDVNLAGAATIAAIQNACSGAELPFAFGGDGGIVLVPPDLGDAARGALAGVQKIGRDVLSLELRCALVPVRAVRALGRDVCVGIHMMSPTRQLAMISGGGIDCAEAIAKSPGGAAYVINASETTVEADLSGLSCRWQPLQAQRGVMLSLIVRARDATQGPKSYRPLYASLQNILGQDPCPVSVANLKSGWPPRNAATERRFGRSLFEVYGQSLLAKVSEYGGLTIGGYDDRNYRRALPSHSDYRKFSDSLRMVVDCSNAEADAVEAILHAAQKRNLIEFGLHRASSALMTCFVNTTDEGQHVHFIDGADGGYALAAQQLKLQIASRT